MPSRMRNSPNRRYSNAGRAAQGDGAYPAEVWRSVAGCLESFLGQRSRVVRHRGICDPRPHCAKRYRPIDWKSYVAFQDGRSAARVAEQTDGMKTPGNATVDLDTPTVFVVDDDPGLCGALAYLLESVRLPCETYATAQQFFRAYDPRRPGCLVLDVRMPDRKNTHLNSNHSYISYSLF